MCLPRHLLPSCQGGSHLASYIVCRPTASPHQAWYAPKLAECPSAQVPCTYGPDVTGTPKARQHAGSFTNTAVKRSFQQVHASFLSESCGCAAFLSACASITHPPTLPLSFPPSHTTEHGTCTLGGKHAYVSSLPLQKSSTAHRPLIIPTTMLVYTTRLELPDHSTLTSALYCHLLLLFTKHMHNKSTCTNKGNEHKLKLARGLCWFCSLLTKYTQGPRVNRRHPEPLLSAPPHVTISPETSAQRVPELLYTKDSTRAQWC